jgi:hypothetical protein
LKAEKSSKKIKIAELKKKENDVSIMATGFRDILNKLQGHTIYKPGFHKQ